VRRLNVEFPSCGTTAPPNSVAVEVTHPHRVPCTYWSCSMRAAEIGRSVSRCGASREGRRAIRFPAQPIQPALLGAGRYRKGAPSGRARRRESNTPSTGSIAGAVANVDVIVNPPALASTARNPILPGEGTPSLALEPVGSDGFNLTTVCVTGTKVKSTTASLSRHTWQGSADGWRWSGISASRITRDRERNRPISRDRGCPSYHAADFDGQCDIACADLALSRAIDWHPRSRELIIATRSTCWTPADADHSPRRGRNRRAVSLTSR